jgi:hypothetical protein
MVAPNKLTSARVVKDQVELKGTRRIPLGTKVREDILTRDPDTLFPSQGALGYEITQSLFIGKHTLLVEGASDILYLQGLPNALKTRKRTGLDTRWTLCPTGGIGNVRAFVSLFGGNKLDIAVLADQTKQDAKKIEELRKSEILRAGKVLAWATAHQWHREETCGSVPRSLRRSREADLRTTCLAPIGLSERGGPLDSCGL